MAHMFPDVNANDGDMSLIKAAAMSLNISGMRTKEELHRRGSWLAVVKISSLPKLVLYPYNMIPVNTVNKRAV